MMSAGPRFGRSARVDIVDALRGIALLGIVLVNVMTFTAGVGADSLGGLDAASTGADIATYALTALLLEYKFYPLFAMLFGFGAADLWHRWAIRGVNIPRAWLRRMLILGVLGLINGLMIYAGDVLTRYACAGILFWLFSPRRMNAKQAFRRAWIWGGIALSLGLAFGLMLSAMALTGEPLREFFGREGAAHTIYSWGSFAQVTTQRFDDYFAILSSAVFFAIPTFVACMYLGYALQRARFFQRALRSSRLAWRWVCFGLAFGVPLNVAYTLVKTYGQLGQHASMLAYESMLAIPISSLCFAYVGAFVLLWPTVGPRLRYAMVALGRVSLTNYLTTALALSLMLYGYGLGLGDAWRQAKLLMAGAGVWCAVAMLSLLWARRWPQGLVERVLRA